MNVGHRNAALRAYLRRFVPVMLIYAVLVFAAPYAIWAWRPEGPFLWAIAVLPALPIIGVFWIIARYILELTDEYLRMLEVRKALVATAFALSIASIWGFLEIYADVPHLPAFFVPVFWFAGLGVGSIVNLVLEQGGEA
ncbi:MAG: hypothetical protein C0476_06540 [Sphingomonas sp.]|nr:hypothetical protein [Sphingomonas sp.]